MCHVFFLSFMMMDLNFLYLIHYNPFDDLDTIDVHSDEINKVYKYEPIK